MRFEDLIAVNNSRAKRWHPDFPNGDWTISDWSNALAGEVGEACNIVKKMRRNEFDLKQMEKDSEYDLPTMLAHEIADVILYALLLATVAKLDIRVALMKKFNEVSLLQGFPERIDLDGYTTNGEWHLST